MHNSTFPLFETIAIIDGQPQNLYLHQQRYLRSLQQYYGIFGKIADFSTLIQVPVDFQTGLVRCRLDYNQHIQQLRFFPYQRRQFINFQPVLCDEIHYDLKFSQRMMLDILYTQRQNADEILIVKKGLITDCSIGNLLFKRQGQWFSPQTPLLQGTQRELLLRQEKIQLRHIKLSELDLFEDIRVINALNPLEDT